MIDIASYKGFYIKKGEDDAVESNATWGVLVKSVPFNIVPGVKDYASNDWADEDGDDVFIPSSPVYKGYDVKFDFVYVGDGGSANEKIHAFWSYLQGSSFKFYDSYSGIGRQGVYFKSYDPGTFRRRSMDVVQFSMVFRVTDPVTSVTL